MKPKFHLGFQNQEQELTGVLVPVAGTLPDWLSGTLVRVCPTKFDYGEQQTVNHWFDGLSMLHNFVFRNDQVFYGCKFLVTKAYTNAKALGRLWSQEFGTNPAWNKWERILAVLQPHPTDNANVNVARICNAFVALTETSYMTEFDAATLQTAGEFKFDDRLSGQITTPHPQIDYADGSLFNLLIRVSASSTYQIYRLPRGSAQRKLISSIPVSEPAYIHSFALTNRYVVVTEFPHRLRPLELVFSGKPYIKNYHWQPSQGTRFHVIEKNTGKLLVTLESDACFAFHHVNAFERGGEILLDVLVYKDSNIIDALNLRNLRETQSGLPPASLLRFSLDIDKRRVACEALHMLSLELPRINDAACSGRDYSFAYFVAASTPYNFLDQLVKIELKSGNTKTWQADGCYPGEPVFVAKPHAKREDEGVVLSLVLDTTAKTSFLVALDSSSMEEFARLRLPHVVAFGFHGQFFDDKN